MVNFLNMKKGVILAVVLVFLIGGGIGIYFTLNKRDNNNFDAEYDNNQNQIAPYSEIEEPYVVAKEKLVLSNCENTANVCAKVCNLNDYDLEYTSLNSSIAEVDSLGNVKALGAGETIIKSFVSYDDKEYSYSTKVVILPNEIETNILLVDEEGQPVLSPLLGEKYTLKMESNVDLGYFSVSMLATDSVVIDNKVVSNTNCTCEIYFETKTQHTLRFKLNLKADNLEKTYLSDEIIFDNSDKTDNQDEETEQINQNEDEPDSPPDIPQPKNDDEPIDETTNAENDDTSDKDVDENTDETNVEKTNIFTLSSSSKNIDINNSTIRFSDFVSEKLVAISFTIPNSDKKYSIKFEIISGNNVEIEIETSLIGLNILSKGTTTFRLYAQEDQNISQIFTIIVE